MSWSFGNAPATSALDAVRLYVGDTDTTDQVVSDEAINWMLSQNTGAVLPAAAGVARLVATKFARQVDQAAGGTKQMLSQRAKAFLTLAKDLEGQAGIGVGGGLTGNIVAPIVTGVSIDEMETVASNPDRPGGVWPESDIFNGDFDQPLPLALPQ